MNVVKTFNGLNGKVVLRSDIERMIAEANANEQYHLAKRLQAVLDRYPSKNLFDFEIEKPAFEAAKKSDLYGIDFDTVEDEIGLNKAVSPNDIYQMITDKMIELIKTANRKDYKKTWEAKSYGTGYTIPFNFASKKRYRGVNVFLLSNFEPMQNPFFLTFKQVEELKGKVKKGSKGFPVVYFTELHKVENHAKGIDFGSYDKKKAIEFAIKHGFKANDVITIPILKYYNVFNGADIEGINFDLENFKIGFIENEMPVTEKMLIPELIVENFPKPKVPISHGGDRAFYSPSSDRIQMPHMADFDSVQYYYRTLFHELSHSTGSSKRLNRDFSGKFGSKKYAFEELVAEWGATFLSAEAGIVWHTMKHGAYYIKNWNNVLTFLEDDNRFIMRACTEAQKVADFVLQFNDQGEPLYFEDLKKIKPEPIKIVKPKKKKPAAAKKPKKVVVPAVEKITKVEIEEKVKAIVRKKREKKTKFTDPNQTKLLGPAPEVFQVEEEAIPIVPVVQNNSKYKTAYDRENENKAPKQLYKIKGDLAKFLGNIEIKPEQSLAITLDSEEGGGKTHLVYQWANDFCNAGYRPIIWSLEEHATSQLSTDKAKKYFGKNIACIPIESENSGDSKEETFARILESIPDFDVIIIDSWAKLMELNSKANFDQDFRKRFNGKLFIVIFQRTVDGKMRGGAKGAFDGDIILKGVVDRSNYQNNYVFNHKNRYNNHAPLSELKYSPYLKGLLPLENPQVSQPIINQNSELQKLSFVALEQ